MGPLGGQQQVSWPGVNVLLQPCVISWCHHSNCSGIKFYQTQLNLIEKISTIEPTNLPDSPIKFDFWTQSNPVKLNWTFQIITQNKEIFFRCKESGRQHRNQQRITRESGVTSVALPKNYVRSTTILYFYHPVESTYQKVMNARNNWARHCNELNYLKTRLIVLIKLAAFYCHKKA